MRVRWFGQAAFLLENKGDSVFLDPFGDVGALVKRGIQWTYPPISGVEASLLLVTHEHLDHNGVAAIGGSPQVIRSTAGTIESPIGVVTAIASEHDPAAGTQRGPNSIYVFGFGGLRVVHFGDFGQRELRSEQRKAIGEVDVLFLPVGGVSTIDGAAAASLARSLQPRWVVPMHYRTPAISFLDPADIFLQAFDESAIIRLADTVFDTAELPANDDITVVVPAPPTGGVAV